MASNSVFTLETCTKPPDYFSNGVFYREKALSHVLPLFSFQIVLIVLTSQLLYFFLRRLKQPRVVCDILAGILLGPTMPYLLTPVLAFFHGLFRLQGERPDYAHVRQRYLDTIFREDGISLMRTAASVGLVLHFFFVCVRMNLGNLMRCGKKAFAIAIATLVVPYFFLSQLGNLLFPGIKGQYVDGVGYPPSISYINISVSNTSFPVIGSILAEFRLLNTEVGRLAMAAALICDNGVSIYMLISAIVNRSIQRKMGVLETLSKVQGFTCFILFIIFVFRPWIRWIQRRTPKGGRVWEGHLLMIILSVIAASVYSDAYLSSYWDGPIIMGFVVPDAPPLGTALIEKTEFIPTELLMPLTYLIIGRWVDFTAIQHFKPMFLLHFYMFAGYFVKVLAAMVPAIYCNVPIRNAALMGLMISFNGIVQLGNFMGLADSYSSDITMVEPQAYIALIFSAIAVTAISAVMVVTFYDPLKSSHIMGCQTVQHLKPQVEFRLVASVLNEEPVPLLLNLVEALCADEQSPTCVYMMHLVELMGRVNSSIISHKNRKGSVDSHQMDRLHNVFINYEQTKKGIVAVQPYTAVSPYKTMHHDVCMLAMEKNVHVVIVPFPRKGLGGNVEADLAARNVVSDVLKKALCSVGVLIHHHTLTGFAQTVVPGQFEYNVKILFWGGGDDREALAIGMRMAKHSGVRVLVTRFIPVVEQKKAKEEISDGEILREFKLSNAENERVAIEEVVANDVEETVSVIKSVDRECDLVIVGRRPGSSSLLGEGMDEWMESPELGMVGDILASSDFSDYTFSVLVVQQYA